MKLIAQIISTGEAEQLRIRLHLKGIPARVDKSSIAHEGQRTGLYIYIDEQYEEALALIENPHYEVKHPADMQRFELLHNNSIESNQALSQMIRYIGLFILIFLFIFIIILGLG